jgi:probable HAF family extracellular repeat protein
MVYSLPFLTQSGEFPMAARSRRYFCHVLYFLVACASLAVAQGTYTQIDFPSALMSEATGINRAGLIVGIYADDIGGHGFLLHNGIYTTIDYPGAQYSYAQGINDKGQIVGLAEPIGYVFDMNEQSFTSIQYPGASFTYPVAINNAGAIAGYFQTPHMAYRGFELVNLDYTKVSPPTSIASFVNGITAEGDLVGYAEIHNSYSNFAFRQGKFGPITIPAATAPFVLGTNPAGTAVVGYYQVFSGIVGFVYQNRILQTLSFPGSITTIATGINANGDVVGYFIDSSDVTHGFLWTASAAMPKQPQSR